MKILNADNRGNRYVQHSEINATIKMDAVCSSESLELTQSQKITRSSKMFTVTKTLRQMQNFVRDVDTHLPENNKQ
jgi:hypothetical protein